MTREARLTQGTIRYREEGIGEPLLFIHGLAVNGDLWRKVVPRLSKDFRCIVPDWPLGSHPDKLFPFDYPTRFAAGLPNARVGVIPDARTFAPEDQPEALAGAIAAFVREPARSRA
jgi:pimeloyl-ACP methyl ester carboxylesterase